MRQFTLLSFNQYVQSDCEMRQNIIEAQGVGACYVAGSTTEYFYNDIHLRSMVLTWI